MVTADAILAEDYGQTKSLGMALPSSKTPTQAHAANVAALGNARTATGPENSTPVRSTHRGNKVRRRSDSSATLKARWSVALALLFVIHPGPSMAADEGEDDYNLALKAFHAGEMQKAEYLAGLATTNNPEGWQAWQLLGDCEVALGKPSDALRPYTMSVRIHPDNPPLHAFLDSHGWGVAKTVPARGSKDLGSIRQACTDLVAHEGFRKYQTLGGMTAQDRLLSLSRGIIVQKGNYILLAIPMRIAARFYAQTRNKTAVFSFLLGRSGGRWSVLVPWDAPGALYIHPRAYLRELLPEEVRQNANAMLDIFMSKLGQAGPEKFRDVWDSTIAQKVLEGQLEPGVLIE